MPIPNPGRLHGVAGLREGPSGRPARMCTSGMQNLVDGHAVNFFFGE